MTRTLTIAATFGAAALLLSACGGDDSWKGGGPDLPTTQSEECIDCDMPADPTGPELNDRGNIVATLGQEAEITDYTIGEPVISFAVDAITPADCTSDWAKYGSPPVNGHLTAIDMRVATAPELAQSDLGNLFTVSANEFRFVGSDGITRGNLSTMATYGCLDDSEEFTSDILAPGSQYVGKLVLDLPETTGTLVYQPLLLTSAPGTEWNF